jgi:hypothetical protein
MTPWPVFLALFILAAVAVVSYLLNRAHDRNDFGRIEVYQATLAALTAAAWLNFIVSIAPILRWLGVIE